MTKREAILAYVGTLLAASPPAGVSVIQRARQVALDAAQDLPAEVYYPVVDRPAPASRPAGIRARVSPRDTLLRELEVFVDCIAAAGSGTSADAETDPLTEHVVGALCGPSADWKSIGAIGAAEIETAFELEVVDKPLALATVKIQVSYLAQSGDPSAT